MLKFITHGERISVFDLANRPDGKGNRLLNNLMLISQARNQIFSKQVLCEVNNYIFL